MFDGLNIVSVDQWILEKVYIRHKLVLESTQEENRHLGDLGEDFFTRPVLMAQASEVSSRWEYTGSILDQI